MKNKFSICSSLLILALTILASVSVQAQSFNPIDISGFVTAYKPADCGQNGSITIAGITLPIAAGVDASLAFNNLDQAIGSDGIIYLNQLFRSEPYQVVGTGRRLRAYLDSTGRIRMVLSAVGSTGGNPTSSRNVTITGIVTAKTSDSITINNITLKIASGATVNIVADPAKIVRFSGTLNSNNELTGTISPAASAYETARICACPFSGGALNNPLALEQPVLTNPASIQGPVVGVSSGQAVCNQANGSVSFGFVSAASAANFKLLAPETIDQQVYGCFEFTFDQFGWITSLRKANSSEFPAEVGNKITLGDRPEVICGKVGNFTAAPDFSTPTNLGETGQRGSLRIGVAGNASFNFTIGSRQKLTNQELLVPGNNVCVFPVYEPAGAAPTTSPLPGEASPIRQFQLMNGTRVVLQ